MADSQDVLKRAYSNLLSLKTNLPQTHPDNRLEADIVNLYSRQLDKLASIGFDINEFRLP